MEKIYYLIMRDYFQVQLVLDICNELFWSLGKYADVFFVNEKNPLYSHLFYLRTISVNGGCVAYN